MCFGCYEEAGLPAVINERVLAAAAMTARVYEFSGAGGGLHCQVDDWNLDDEHFDKYEPDDYVTADQALAERRCFDALKALSVAERHTALAIHDGYLTTDGHLTAISQDALAPEEDISVSRNPWWTPQAG